MRALHFVLCVLCTLPAFYATTYSRASAQTAGTCAQSTYGQISGTFTITTSGTYRMWSRLKPSSTTTSNNSYSLEIDSTTCYGNIGDATIPTNTWTWVDYKDGNTSSKTIATLSAGTHSFKAIGREPGVQLDKILFVLDPLCTPVNDGQNCTASSAVASFEGESMAAPSSNVGAVTSDTGASGASSFLVWGDGYISRTLPTRAAKGITIRARAEQCNGAPTMSVKIDGQVLFSTSVQSTTYTDYSYAVTLTAQSHVYEIGMTNDYFVVQGCDRNIYIDTVSFPLTAPTNAPAPTPTPTTPTTTPPTTTPTTPRDVTPPVVTQSFPNVSTTGLTTGVVTDVRFIEFSPTATDNVSVRSLNNTVNGTPITLTNNTYTTPSVNQNYIFLSTAIDSSGLESAVTKTLKLRHPDIDRSGKVDTLDILRVLRKFNSTASIDLGFDFNGDDRVTTYDILYILRSYSK